jgi:quinol-cytochrome oxidoreductase complex cytochrome b subunit/mono/diheme cytochrome c family protein
LLNQLARWLEDRTGHHRLVRTHSEELIKGGARWRYVFGSTLAAVFLIQAFSGVLMMTAYSPSSSTAWGSVYYIENVMWMGWFIRGLHHFGAQTLMVLLLFHVLQVLVAGAYRMPREVNWWFGLVLLILTVGFSHTGYQLPWDQKGYWATKVVTSIMGGAPVIGPALKTLVVGGTEYGNQTITRFYGLHVGILPALMFACLAAHVALARRHGLTTPAAAEALPAEPYWPAQTFKNRAFLAVVVGVMVALVLIERGAPLDAPADPSSSDYPARPEWFFLFLFQMLKHFPGRLEWVGSIVIPSTILLVLFLLPLFERVFPSRLVHFLACALVFALVGGAGYLTVESLQSDASDKQFLEARKKADAAKERARFLAASPDHGIPPEGAGFLMRRDPLTQGLAVLDKKCLGCHVLGGKGTGEQTACDLKDFGSRAWIRGLLENPQSPAYYGKVPKCDGMAEWKKSSKLKAKELDDVADFVASFAGIADDMTPDEWLNSPGVAKHPGSVPFQKECGQCHKIEGYTEGGTRDAPGLFAWGSPQWITRMIRKPNAPDLYGYFEEKDRMPPFGPEQLTRNDVEMVIRYLRNDYPKPQRPATASTAAHPSTDAGRLASRQR